MTPAESSDQRRAVAAVMVAAGAIVAQQVAGKATRDALFLSTFHISSLPLAMIASALTSAIAVLAFSAALTRRSPARVVPAALAAGTVLLLGEWGLSVTHPRLAAVAVYLHMAAFGATVVSSFWSFINELFDPYTARRVMDRVGLGASLGGVMGGVLAWSAAGVAPVPAMLAVMAALNVVALLALSRLRAPAAAARASAADTSPLSGLRLMREVPYLRDLALIVALGAASEALLDYLLSARAAATFAPGQPLMSFFALFHTAVGLLALAFQLALSGPALRRMGLAGTVALRPASVAIAAIAGAFDPRLLTALAARGAHGVLHNSLFRSGYELLFTPLPERRKRPTKTIVDVGFDKLGALTGACLALAAVSAFGASSSRAMFAAAAACALAALAVSRRLHLGYVTALEESLRSGVVRLEAADVRDGTTSLTLARTGLHPTQTGVHPGMEPVEAGGLPQAVADLQSGDAEAIRRALKRADAGDPALVGHLIPLLARNDVFLDVLRALRRAAPLATGQLLDALLDPGRSLAVRRRIPRVLRGTPTQRAADGLVEALADASLEVRRQSALTLARITERAPSLRVPPPAVFAAVLRETAVAPQEWTDDSLAHVFTLLSLAVEREPVLIAHRALRGGDEALRGTALEYLENVLPAEVRQALRRHLGARATPSATRPAEVLRGELLKSSEK